MLQLPSTEAEAFSNTFHPLNWSLLVIQLHTHTQTCIKCCRAAAAAATTSVRINNQCRNARTTRRRTGARSWCRWRAVFTWKLLAAADWQLDNVDLWKRNEPPWIVATGVNKCRRRRRRPERLLDGVARQSAVAPLDDGVQPDRQQKTLHETATERENFAASPSLPSSIRYRLYHQK